MPAWERDSVGEEYGLSGSSVARLLRVNYLINPFKDKVDKGSLGMKIAIQLSYLTKEEQEMIHDAMKEMHVKLSQHQVIKLREHAGELTTGRVRQYIKMAAVYLPEDFVIYQMRAEYRNQARLNDIIYPYTYKGDNKITVCLCNEEKIPYVVVEFQQK